jgi:DNA (cytosine-5)-methyltransferase 1
MFKVVSLFCGCGGADLGILGNFDYLGKSYSKNKFSIVSATDICRHAVNSYNLNFKHKALQQDIRNFEFKGNADLVVGGFPCQSFSTVNPTKDPNNRDTQLFWEMSNVIDSLAPKAFIAENVKGFMSLSKGKFFDMAKKEFEKNYNVSVKLLNSSHYGVPQLRERVIFVGLRKDLGKHFKFPEPTHVMDKKSTPPVVLSSVIDSLIPEDEKFYFSDRAVQGAKNAKKNMKRLLAQDLDKPCLTITSHLAKVSINSRDPVLLVDPKSEKYRRFSPREAARIQSFPDDFDFEGADGHAYRQIGNAIPPVLMWHIARKLQKELI